MAQVLQISAGTPGTPGTIVPVRSENPDGSDGTAAGSDGAVGCGDTVHGARLVDVGSGELRPVLPVCGALIVPVPADGPITCEICRIRMHPDAFTKVIRLALRVVRRWLRPGNKR